MVTIKSLNVGDAVAGFASVTICLEVSGGGSLHEVERIFSDLIRDGELNEVIMRIRLSDSSYGPHYEEDIDF
jgi:hypothetical protein